MICLKPKQGYRSAFKTVNGKYPFTYSTRKAMREFKMINGTMCYVPVHMQTTCHTCDACRYNYSKEMALRISHEASLYDGGFNNAFITLTYNEDQIPPDRSLHYGEFDDIGRFIRRLRTELSPLKLRYYLVGEYGDLFHRPHYHVLILGYNFPDKKFKERRDGHDFYVSELVYSLWASVGDRGGRGSSLGNHYIGAVNFTVAAYVCRYQMKKLIGNFDIELSQYSLEDTGEIIPKRLLRFNMETGEPYAVQRERALSSKRPGIGKSWFDKHFETDFQTGVMHYNGSIVSPGKYYLTQLEKVNPDMLERLRKVRQSFAEDHPERYSESAIKFAKLELKRKLAMSKKTL